MLILVNFLFSKESSIGPSTSEILEIKPSAGLTKKLSSWIENPIRISEKVVNPDR